MPPSIPSGSYQKIKPSGSTTIPLAIALMLTPCHYYAVIGQRIVSVLRNEKGFTPFDIVLTVLLVIAVGVASYFAYKNHQDQQQSSASVAVTSPQSTTTQNTTQPVNPYTGWKTYTSSYQNVSFQYPTNWSLSTQPDSNAPGSSAEDAIITSPSGLTLTYHDAVGGLGGGCPPGSPDVTLTAVQQLASANSSQSLYMIQSGSAIGLDMKNPAPVVGDVGYCLLYPLIMSKAHAGDQFSFATNVQFPAGTPPILPASQVQDFAAAKLILESFKYNS